MASQQARSHSEFDDVALRRNELPRTVVDNLHVGRTTVSPPVFTVPVSVVISTNISTFQKKITDPTKPYLCVVELSRHSRAVKKTGSETALGAR
jgi:hypothetical protein